MTASPVICAVDVGTTGVKCSVIDTEHGPLANHYVEHRLVHPRPGWVEQDPARLESAIWDAISGAVAAGANRRRGVAAVAVTSARASFVPLDRGGLPHSPFIIWQDQRSLDICKRLESEFGPERYYQRTGLRLDPVAVASKARWLRDHDPSRWAATAQLCSAQGFGLRLLGADGLTVPVTMAAYYGLLDLVRRDWDEELLALFGVAEGQLPRVVPDGSVVGTLSRDAADRTGLVTGTPLVAAPSDWASTQVGAGAIEEGLAVVYLGTGGATGTYTPRPRLDPERRLTCLPNAVRGAYSVEGLLITGAAAYRWFRDVLGFVSQTTGTRDAQDVYALLEREALTSPAGSRGVLAIPTLSGSGAPHWLPEARGMFLGLALDTGRADLIRAIVEGVAMDVADLVDAIMATGAEIRSVTLTGPPSGSDLWCQVIADMCAVPIRTAEPRDPTMAGAAASAAVAVGLAPDLATAIAPLTAGERIWTPRTEQARLHTDLRAARRAVLDAFARDSLHGRLLALRGAV